jgi:ParB family chromosome partitioning protein
MVENIESIALDLIDDPHAPMRSQMDEEKLDELARSIKTHGLIQPITLRKTGARYEVVAGHRRFKACKRAGLAKVSAIVRKLDDRKADEMRMHENLYREDVNPVDEARYIRKMVDTHQVEPSRLAEMTGKSEAYLQSRYDLLSYPDYLIEAVESEKVSLTAAQWLARIQDDRVRAEYTRFAILGGITAKRAEAWYRSWTMGSLPREAHMFEAPPADPNAEPRVIEMPCLLCRHLDSIDKLTMDYVHADCAKAVVAMQRETTL